MPSSHFKKSLADACTTPVEDVERWYHVAYDQLHLGLEPLCSQDPTRTGILLIESSTKGRRRPYHKQKLATLLSCLRHFAVEAAQAGFHVQHLFTTESYARAIEAFYEEHDLCSPICMMRPAEYELLVELEPLCDEEILTFLAHSGWLTTEAMFLESQKSRKQSWLMDTFYKHVRRELDILLDEEGKPLGGKFSFDADNRKPWSGSPSPPSRPTFSPDAITAEVCELIEAHFGDHPGTLSPEHIAASRQDALDLLERAISDCMEHFGPYEDAMHTSSHHLFHTLLSPLINLHRLSPREVLDRVLALEPGEPVPLQSIEGFTRQLIGWREFMHHVHEQTCGLRALPSPRTSPETAPEPGDAGWSAYVKAKSSWSAVKPPDPIDGGATPNVLEAHEDLPAAFWGEATQMLCLDHVVRGVMETGWSHHIERLMILGNLATLLDISPRQLTDWFWVAYIDAYDWVVEPNVLGMATFGVGDLFTTKPYVSGANYIDKMSNFCSECALDPGSTCPVTHLYWSFLSRHARHLQDNPRMGLVYNQLGKRDASKQALDQAIFEHVRDTLRRGEALDPKRIEEIHEEHTS